MTSITPEKARKMWKIIREEMPPEEAERIRTAILTMKDNRYVDNLHALNVAAEIILAGERTKKKGSSDRRTDRKRRILVGARLAREEAEKYREAARERGESVYAWVKRALEREYMAQRKKWKKSRKRDREKGNPPPG